VISHVDSGAAAQISQVRICAAYARRNSRYYSKALAGIDIEGADAEVLMDLLPFTDPGAVAASPEDFLCVPAKDVAGIITLPTSGTTASPKRIFFTESDIGRTVDFFSRGMKPIIGNARKAAIALPGESPHGVASLLSAALEAGGVKTVRPVSYDSLDPGALGGCGCFVGAPVPLMKLSRACPGLRPQSALLSTDYVPRAVAERIRETWRCAVYSHYGLTETGFGCAVQCHERKEHHIRHSEMLLEIVDPLSGARLPQGEEGEIVITTFAAEAMPLIRYRTGDTGSLTDTRCACGGRFSRLTNLKGRYANPAAHPFSLNEIDEIMFSDRTVWDYSAALKRTERRLMIKVESDGGMREQTERALTLFCSAKGYEAVFFNGKIDTDLNGRNKRRITSAE